MGVLFVCAIEIGLSCEKCLLGTAEKSGVAMWYGEGLVLTARSGTRRREVKVAVGHCAYVEGEFGACYAQDSEDVVLLRACQRNRRR